METFSTCQQNNKDLRKDVGYKQSQSPHLKIRTPSFRSSNNISREQRNQQSHHCTYISNSYRSKTHHGRKRWRLGCQQQRHHKNALKTMTIKTQCPQASYFMTGDRLQSEDLGNKASSTRTPIPAAEKRNHSRRILERRTYIATTSTQSSTHALDDATCRMAHQLAPEVMSMQATSDDGKETTSMPLVSFEKQYAAPYQQCNPSKETYRSYTKQLGWELMTGVVNSLWVLQRKNYQKATGLQVRRAATEAAWYTMGPTQGKPTFEQYTATSMADQATSTEAAAASE